MSKGFITGTNEELIKAYKESRDESYLKELIEANKGLINLLVSPYLTSIPNAELEDLTSESYIPMLRAIEDYDPEQGVAFSTLMYASTLTVYITRLHARKDLQVPLQIA